MKPQQRLGHVGQKEDVLCFLMPCHVSFPFPICLQYDNKKIVFWHGIRNVVIRWVTIRENQTKPEPKSYPAETYRFEALGAKDLCDSAWNSIVTDLRLCHIADSLLHKESANKLPGPRTDKVMICSRQGQLVKVNSAGDTWVGGHIDKPLTAQPLPGVQQQAKHEHNDTKLSGGFKLRPRDDGSKHVRVRPIQNQTLDEHRGTG